MRGGSKLISVLETENHLTSRPVCHLHERWLLVIIPGVKSIAYDIFTQKHTDFQSLPIPLKLIS